MALLKTPSGALLKTASGNLLKFIQTINAITGGGITMSDGDFFEIYEGYSDYVDFAFESGREVSAFYE